MSVSSQVQQLINQELSRVTPQELELVKTAGVSRIWGLLSHPLALAAGVAGGAGIGYAVGSSSKEKELEALKADMLKRNIASAVGGGALALAARKPFQGALQPDPEDLTSIEDESFDDIWKQRTRKR
tara:strand:+ start:134 stop:514 length:381 start_codon:yes stop_codon:yes gene_type:complete